MRDPYGGCNAIGGLTLVRGLLPSSSRHGDKIRDPWGRVTVSHRTIPGPSRVQPRGVREPKKGTGGWGEGPEGSGTSTLPTPSSVRRPRLDLDPHAITN